MIIKIGKSSSRPASISIIITNFEKALKIEKFCVGPTKPKPGPMLFKVAITAVALVVKSKLSIDTSKSDRSVMKK